MDEISRKTGNVADFPLKMDLQLFAEDEEGDYPNLDDQPESKEDMREYEKMNAKMDKFTADREPKEPVKETKETEPVKEPVKAVTEEVATPEQKPKQDKETNDAFQEMRKKTELLEAKAKKADALIAEQFGSQGITTVEQYETWIKQGEVEAETKRLTDAGLQPEEIEKLRKYDEIVASTKVEQETKTKEAWDASWNTLYAAYPDIVEDSKAFVEGKDPLFFNAAMKAELARGASPLAAYRNAHFETILANATKSIKEVTKQETLNQLNSKDHIKANGNASGEIEHIEIDPVQMAMYRKMVPGKSDADIRKFAKQQLAGG